MNADCTVLVVSCDAYADVVPPFIALKRRFWPDCPFETVLLTETVGCEGFDRTVFAGKCNDWCPRVLRALERIETPYVLLLLNDYYLNAPVDTAKMLALLAAAQEHRALNLRMNPNPPAGEAFVPAGAGGPLVTAGETLYAFPKNTAYCVSCQAGFWNRAFFTDLVRRNRSAWEFERFGSYGFDAAETRPLLVTGTKAFPFVDAVHKGYWEREGAELLAANGIACDIAKRGFPPFRVRAKEAVKRWIFNLNPELVTRLQNRLSG